MPKNFKTWNDSQNDKACHSPIAQIEFKPSISYNNFNNG